MVEWGNLRRWGRADALVTAVVCLMLVLLAPVLLAKPREQSVRVVCAANLSQIGKTMVAYAADNERVLAQAGNKWGIWGATTDWAAPNRIAAFGSSDEGIAGQATISSSFYLLVKYCQMPTRLFLDGRVTFERRAYCGVESDNIYLCSNAPDWGTPMGVMPVVPWALPMNREDSLLVHDPNDFPLVVGPQRR